MRCIYVCISLYLFFIFVLCLGYLGFKEFLFRMAQTIISMFALRTRAAHLLLDCPPDTLRCACFASRLCPGHRSVCKSLATARDFCNWRRRTSFDGNSVRYCATRIPDLSLSAELSENETRTILTPVVRQFESLKIIGQIASFCARSFLQTLSFRIHLAIVAPPVRQFSISVDMANMLFTIINYFLPSVASSIGQ